MIWDADGAYRLSIEDTVDIWKTYRDEAASHYGFDDKQKKKADTVFKSYDKQLKYYIGSNAEDIDEYFKGLDRRDRYKGTMPDEDPDKAFANRAYREVPSLRGQLTRIEGELKKKRDGWLPTIDKLWTSYERDINAIATDEQRGAGKFVLPRVGRRAMDSVTVDRFIPYFDLTIGALLIIGLFTRISAIGGASFLASVALTQWPLAPDAAPIYYQVVELCSLLVLAGTAAGRFAGLDFFIHAATSNWSKKQTT
jgi:hypothetical protein